MARYQVVRQPLLASISQSYPQKPGIFWMSIFRTHILGYQLSRSMTCYEHLINIHRIVQPVRHQDLAKMQLYGQP